MRRLIKKSIAMANVQRFLQLWTQSAGNYISNQEMIYKILDENPDCLYQGTVLRFLEMDVGEILESDPQLRMNYFDKNIDIIPMKFINEALSKKVTMDDKLYSSAKTLKGINSFLNGEPRDGIVIEFTTNDGLDIPKLITKYEDYIKEIDYDTIFYESEEEVITKIPNDFIVKHLRFNKNFIELNTENFDLNSFDNSIDW